VGATHLMALTQPLLVGYVKDIFHQQISQTREKLRTMIF
jgi:hypothetical protein